MFGGRFVSIAALEKYPRLLGVGKLDRKHTLYVVEMFERIGNIDAEHTFMLEHGHQVGVAHIRLPGTS